LSGLCGDQQKTHRCNAPPRHFACFFDQQIDRQSVLSRHRSDLGASILSFRHKYGVDQVRRRETRLPHHAAKRLVLSKPPEPLNRKGHRYFLGRFVRNTTRSRTEIIPTNFPSRETPRCRTWAWAIRSLASRSVLFSSIDKIGADMICSTVVFFGSLPDPTLRRIISLPTNIPMISFWLVTNRLPMPRSRIIRAAVCAFLARSTVTNFSLGTMNDFTGTMKSSLLRINAQV